MFCLIACEDHRGISQVGKKEFIYSDMNTQGVIYRCSCFQNPKVQAICGAKCEKIVLHKCKLLNYLGGTLACRLQVIKETSYVH